MSGMRRVRTWAVACLLAVGLALQPGCGHRLALGVARVVAVGVAAAAVLAGHDAHMHSHVCGHEYVIIEDREVYHYQGRWEYYDPDTGEWYEYEEVEIE